MLSRKMTEKEKQKASIAAKRLRNYQKKKYGKIDYGWVSEGVSQAWLRRFHEENRKRRLLK